jgi:uncharacterized protein
MTGQRISNVDNAGDSEDLTGPAGRPDPEGPTGGTGPESPAGRTGPEDPTGPTGPKSRKGLTRREALVLLGVGALVTEQAVLNGPSFGVGGSSTRPADAAAELAGTSNATPVPGGYAPDGTAGRAAALPLTDVQLLDSPFLANQGRNTAYLLFLDPDRMLRPFRLNYGVATQALPCGGWEHPTSEIRGHTTGHLMSALAITYANTGNDEALARGRYLVNQLAALQAKATTAGFHPGYLSAFPEVYFDWLEAGQPVWSPYYMIHKYLAGLIDQYQLAKNDQALDVAVKLGDWVDWRTARLPYAQMQMVLQNEYGGLPEALANLYTITGRERYLAAAQRFDQAQLLDPLAAGSDQLAGLQANVTTPKIIACVRLWEETGETRYRDIAQNFWDLVTGHHVYVIGGAGNYEHFQQPDAVAGQLSNFTCENCVSYNLLKLTRLLHFHQLTRTDLIDYYERTLFNQMLGEQDPTSPHGFNCYYTGLSPGAFKRQPLNYFPGGNPGIYATDWDTFTCDTATGLETQAKFADTIYTRDADGLYVNLFIPSRVRVAGLTLQQATGFPDDPVISLSVLDGTATMTLRVRVPAWTDGPPVVMLNHTLIPDASAGGWVAIRRRWQRGDLLQVTLPMQLAFEPAPDHPPVQALTYGPVVLSGVFPASPGTLTPPLETGSVQQTGNQPMTFGAISRGKPVTLIPVSRAAHEYYSVYWQTT